MLFRSLVVCDFPDVFPEELPEMPPDKAVEFMIELEPGTAPISKRLYKIAPPELELLKEKINMYMEKGYIQPSSSAWGCPTLFVAKKDQTKRLMRVRTSFCGPISRIDSRTRDEHEEHEERGRTRMNTRTQIERGNCKNSKD